MEAWADLAGHLGDRGRDVLGASSSLAAMTQAWTIALRSSRNISSPGLMTDKLLCIRTKTFIFVGVTKLIGELSVDVC